MPRLTLVVFYCTGIEVLLRTARSALFDECYMFVLFIQDPGSAQGIRVNECVSICWSGVESGNKCYAVVKNR